MKGWKVTPQGKGRSETEGRTRETACVLNFELERDGKGPLVSLNKQDPERGQKHNMMRRTFPETRRRGAQTETSLVCLARL